MQWSQGRGSDQWTEELWQQATRRGIYRGYDIRSDEELGVLCRHRNVPDVEVEAGHTPALLDVARKTIDFVLDNPNVDYRELLGKQIVDYQGDDE